MGTIRLEKDADLKAFNVFEREGHQYENTGGRSTMILILIMFLFTLGFTFTGALLFFLGSSQSSVDLKFCGASFVVLGVVFCFMIVILGIRIMPEYNTRPFLGFQKGFYSGKLPVLHVLKGTVPIYPYEDIMKVRYIKCARGSGGLFVNYPHKIQITLSSGKKLVVRNTNKLEKVLYFLYRKVPSKFDKKTKEHYLTEIQPILVMKATKPIKEERKAKRKLTSMDKERVRLYGDNMTNDVEGPEHDSDEYL